MSEETNTPANTPADTNVSPERAGAPAPVDGGQAGADAGAEPEQQQNANPGEGEGAQPKPVPEHRTVQGRISEYQRKARAAELAAAEERGRRLALEEALRIGAKPQAQEEQAPPAPQGPPDPKNYPQGAYDPRYAADLAKYEIREEQRAEAAKAEERERKAAEDREFQAGLERYNATLAKARELADSASGEYFQHAERFLSMRLPNVVMDAVTTSDNAVHVAEILGRNPEDIPESLRALVKSPRELADMSPVQVQRTIARLDDRIGLIIEANARRAQQPAPAPKTAPQPSPAPIPTVQGGGNTPSKDPSKMSMQEFAAWRAAGGGA